MVSLQSPALLAPWILQYIPPVRMESRNNLFSGLSWLAIYQPSRPCAMQWLTARAPPSTIHITQNNAYSTLTVSIYIVSHSQTTFLPSLSKMMVRLHETSVPWRLMYADSIYLQRGAYDAISCGFLHFSVEVQQHPHFPCTPRARHLQLGWLFYLCPHWHPTNTTTECLYGKQHTNTRCYPTLT